MRYINAAEVLPEELLKELQHYIEGDVIYIPKVSTKKEWGAVSGSKAFYLERNREIKRLFQEGSSLDMLAKQFGLAYNTIRKIVYG